MTQSTNTESSCPSLAGCKIWPAFKTDGKFFWIKQYCQGPKQMRCARAVAKNGCGEIPDNLLPNGEMLG